MMMMTKRWEVSPDLDFIVGAARQSHHRLYSFLFFSSSGCWDQEAENRRRWLMCFPATSCWTTSCFLTSDCLMCHRWGCRGADLRKKNSTWSLASRVQHTHTHTAAKWFCRGTRQHRIRLLFNTNENLFVFFFTFSIFVHIVRRGPASLPSDQIGAPIRFYVVDHVTTLGKTCKTVQTKQAAVELRAFQ